MPHLLILLPGITGSVLQKDEEDVWALSAGAIVRGLLSLGGSAEDLVLHEDPPDITDLADGVTAPRLIQDVHLIPGLWKIDGYSRIWTAIQQEFDVVAGENLFAFPYDWRRDNRVAARLLAERSQDWLAQWRVKSGSKDAKLVLIAHSMGGIVSRYFLEVLEGWRDTKVLVTFGTPFRGSLNSLRFLVEGFKKGPFGLLDLSEALRSFTSVYQLLPTYPVLDTGAGQIRRIGETEGIPHVDALKAADALAFHREIGEAVSSHLGDADYVERGYTVFPVVGIRQPTLQSAIVKEGGLTFLQELRGVDQKGDGTVPRVSATPWELSRAHREMFASTMHGSLQNADSVLAHLYGILSGLDLHLEDFYSPPTRLIPVSLWVEDSYLTSESVHVRAVPGLEGKQLQVEITSFETGEVAVRQSLQGSGDGSQGCELAPLQVGCYRITVGGDESVETVSDVFVVFDAGPG